MGDEVGATVTGLPPLYRSVTGGEKDKLTVLWPFFRQIESEDRRSTSLFPVFYHRRNGAEIGQIFYIDWKPAKEICYLGNFACIAGGDD